MRRPLLKSPRRMRKRRTEMGRARTHAHNMKEGEKAEMEESRL